MNKLLLTLLVSLTLLSNVALAATQTIKANVNGMVCAFCAQGIAKKMRAQPQTQDVYVNLKQRIVAVELKEGQSLPNETVKSLIKDAGYDLTSIEMSELSVAQIKAQFETKQEAK
ncbi:MAG: heavy-metal-associated domain-containing protein [Methylotenera sp.]|nr:heavy-metal-associated domain-containing protein [Methylotenera sp.]